VARSIGQRVRAVGRPARNGDLAAATGWSTRLRCLKVNGSSRDSMPESSALRTIRWVRCAPAFSRRAALGGPLEARSPQIEELVSGDLIVPGSAVRSTSPR